MADGGFSLGVGTIRFGNAPGSAGHLQGMKFNASREIVSTLLRLVLTTGGPDL
jgi:hypothetical protein